MADDKLGAMIDRMIAAGESDEDIDLVVKDYQASLDQVKQNAQVQAAITGPATEQAGFNASIMDTVKGVGTGALKALKSTPQTIVSGVRDAALVFGNPGQLLREKIAEAPQNIAGVEKVLSGDPEAGGAALTNLGMSLLGPHAPAGAVKFGTALETAGELSKPLSLPVAVGEAIMSGNLKGGAAIASVPYVASGLGKVIKGVGKFFGGEPSVPFHEQPVFKQMDALPTTGAAPERFSAPPMQTTTPFHELPIHQQMALSPIEEQAVGSPTPEVKAASGDNTLASEMVNSAYKNFGSLDSLTPIETQEMLRSPKFSVASQVPPSRSSGAQGVGSEMSATPGLTRNDVMSLGMNPDIPIRKLTALAANSILEARKLRKASYGELYNLEQRLKHLTSQD